MTKRKKTDVKNLAVVIYRTTLYSLTILRKSLRPAAESRD